MNISANYFSAIAICVLTVIASSCKKTQTGDVQQGGPPLLYKTYHYAGMSSNLVLCQVNFHYNHNQKNGLMGF